MGTILSSQTLVRSPTLDDDDSMMNAVVLFLLPFSFSLKKKGNAQLQSEKAKSLDSDVHKKKDLFWMNHCLRTNACSFSYL